MWMKVIMINIFLMILFCFTNLVQAYAPKEMLFSTVNFVENGKKPDGSSGCVLRVMGAQQFGAQVLKSKLPVVVKVWTEHGERFQKDQALYQDVAENYKKSVSFVSLSMSENEDVIKFLMRKLKISQVSLPLYLFFKEGALFLPLVSGFMTKDELHKIIQKKFNLLRKNGKSVPEVEPKEEGIDSQESWLNKVKDMFLGFRTLSNQVKSYSLRNRWLREKGIRTPLL
jgi:hypothetical protein